MVFVDELLEMIAQDFAKNVFSQIPVLDGIYQGIPVNYDKRFIKILKHWEENTCKQKSGESSPKKTVEKEISKSTSEPDDNTRVDPKENSPTKPLTAKELAELAMMKKKSSGSSPKKTPEMAEKKPSF